MEQSEQLSLSLPYAEIEKLAVRDTLRKREDISRAGRESWFIPFSSISIRENFNTRYAYEGIIELAESLLSQGQLEPIYVDVLESGEIFIERGHRRYYAIKAIIENNMGLYLPDGTVIRNKDTFAKVECFINKSNMTEMQRILNLFGTNMHSKELKPLEQAETAWRLKYCLGEEISNDEIASKIGVSRQTVDNMILIAKADDSIKNEIKVGNMAFTNAVALIRSQKKLKKQADEKEEEAGQSSMFVQPDPKDSLRDEVAELKAAELQAEIYRDREANKARVEAERLERIANHLEVKEEILSQHIGKRLAADATYTWTENFADVDTGEIVPIDRINTVLKQGELLDENTIKDLVGSNVKMVYVFKEIIPTASVITEPIAEAESPRFDLSRPEMEAMQKLIQGIDKIEAIVTKLDVPDDVKKDIAFQVYWAQRNADTVREYVHKNKKQNKSR